MVVRTFSAQHPSSKASALDEAERAVATRRAELLALYEKAPQTDRLFAVDRLLRDHALRPADVEALLRAHTGVREAWASMRTARITGAQLAAQQAALELAVRERALAALLHERGLVDALLSSSEGYLRRVPREPTEPSYRELLQRRAQARRDALSLLPPVMDAA